MKRSLRVSVSVTWVTAALLGVSAPASPQEPGEVVTLAEALSLFGQNNLELQLARSRLRADLGGIRQDRAIPNPRVAATHEALGEYSESYLNLTQPLDFLWERSNRTHRADALRSRAQAAFLADSVRLAHEVRRAYLDTWQHGETLAAYQQAEEVMDALVASAEARFSEGDLAGYDLRRLRLERLQLGRRSAAAELDLEDAERRLGAFVLDPDGRRSLSAEDPGPTHPSLPAQENLIAEALVNRPEIHAVESLAKALGASTGLARSSVLSGTSLTGGWKRQADGLDGLFLGLEVPLPIADRKKGATDAAQAEVNAAEWEADLLRRTITQQVSLATARLETAQRQQRLLGTGGAEEAQALLDIARLSFEEGEMRAVDLLDATKAFIEARLLDSQVRGDLWTAYFELERAVGGFLNESRETIEGGNER